MHPASCFNTHHDVTDLVNFRMVKRQKNKTTFLQNKKILNLCLRKHILREVTVL